MVQYVYISISDNPSSVAEQAGLGLKWLHNFEGRFSHEVAAHILHSLRNSIAIVGFGAAVRISANSLKHLTPK